MLFKSLRGYQRSWVITDLLAALTLLVIVVPEQLATSRLAGMPPITGYYAFAAGTLLFALLGTSPQVSVGADSTIAPLFAAGVAGFAATGSSRYVNLVGILAVLVGAIVALVWLLRLGWLAEFLSAPIIAGFLGGVSVIIVVHQLPDLFGLPSPSGNTIHRLGSIADHLGNTNLRTLAIAVGVFVVVVAAERIDRRIPGALIALVASTALVAILGLHADGVAELGRIVHGAPRLGLRDVSWSSLGDMAPIAGVVALVVVTQSAATTRAFAERGGYEVDVGRDLLGVGAGSAAAGLIGSFPVNASPPRTAAVAAASGRSQAAGLVSVVAIVALIPAAGLLKDLPLATLAAVLVFVAVRVFPARDLAAIARFDTFEFGLAVVTLLTVGLAGVEPGIGVAIGLAILDRTRLSSRARLYELGRIPGTTSWVPLVAASGAEPQPGVLVLLLAAPLWYGNATRFRAQLHAAMARAGQPPPALVLDFVAVGDVDYTGARALAIVLDELHREHVPVAIARAGHHVRTNLQRSGLLERIGSDRFFESVDEAVTTLQAQRIQSGRAQ